ncbi:MULTISPECIES: hypothetical protein [Streptomyces]|uniref:Uncharacterized protein n=3 Tax=Streptomyces TaxID=1883 RepID=A0ABP7DR73_9ACTN|nr:MULTISPECIES: hypothetical protein [Streptomyces]MBZ3908227.1 hypothetical protein [Streptomyces griseiscabiei]MDX2915639.1 hypothetical protein [Streptomyces griseiscabiei]
MIRETRFLISRKPFAIDLSTVTARQVKHGDSNPYYHLHGQANALWIRRQKGVDRACIGTLSLFRQYMREPVDLDDPRAILTADLDGRHGGECLGRWDGTRYWGAQEPALMEQHLEILRPLLANHENPPAGYDGWWTFQTHAN